VKKKNTTTLYGFSVSNASDYNSGAYLVVERVVALAEAQARVLVARRLDAEDLDVEEVVVQRVVALRSNTAARL
jgi:hypothetical protein